MARITTQRIFIRGKPLLEPVYRRDVEELRAISDRRPLLTTVLAYTETDRLRNWYWALVQTVADGLGIHKDHLHVKIKEEIGFYSDVIPGARGPLYVFKSISRGSLSAAELRAYVQAATEVIFIRFLPGVRRADVFKRVEELEGVRRPK